MNKFIKLLTGLATCILLSFILSISICAANIFTISLGNVESQPGEIVVVPISMVNAPNFFVSTIEIEYDENAMTLLSVQDTGLANGDEHSDKYGSPYTLTWVNNGASISDGVVAELTFKLSNNVEEDLHININLPRDGVIDIGGANLSPQIDGGIIYIVENHEHEYGRWTEYNSVKHMRECDCGEAEYERHSWDDGEITEEPTEDTTGEMTYTCDACGATKTEIIPELPSEDISVNGVTLNKSTAILTVGDTLTLNATVTPYDATNKAVRWTSSNTSVAKVSNGTITALASGTTVITVTTNDGGYTAKCTVTVNNKESEPSTDAQITVGNASARAGGTISVPVVVSNNPGIVSMTLKVSYDTSVLTLTGVTDTGLLSGSMHTTKYTSPYTLTWENDTASANIKVNGTLVYLLFTVSANATEGTSMISITTPMDGIYDYDGDNVDFEMISGSVEIRNYIIGDVNGDGSVTNKDRLVLSRYLAEWDGYDISMIDQKASDVNCDGVITNKDRLVLSRYLAEWDGYETLPVT